MSKVVMQTIVSVDGFMATEDDQVGPLFDWFETGDTPLFDIENGPRVTTQSHDYYRPMLDAIGALVVGRHVFDMTDGWGGRSPAGDHCVVVSHRPAPEGWDPAAPFHFVDNVTDAVRLAKNSPGTGPSRSRRVTSAGRSSRPGSSTRSHSTWCRWCSARASATSARSGQVLLEDPDEVVQGDRVLHLRFRVRK